MSRKGFVYKVIELLLSKITDRFVCISQAEYQSAIRNGIDSGAKLTVIENGINIDSVRKANPFERQDMGIPQDAYIVGMVGRLTPQKAPDIFLKAAVLIHKRIPNAYFIIVGNGEEEDEIRQFAKENHVNLLITGWTDQPYSYLKMFDVAVLLSRWEGFGLAIVEYMAAGKNFVATNVDAIPTIVENGVDGILVNVDSPDEVADKVYYYYTHPKEAKQMCQKAKEKVIAKYDISRVVQQHKELFRSLIQ